MLIVARPAASPLSVVDVQVVKVDPAVPESRNIPLFRRNKLFRDLGLFMAFETEEILVVDVVIKIPRKRFAQDTEVVRTVRLVARGAPALFFDFFDRLVPIGVLFQMPRDIQQHPAVLLGFD